MQNLRSIIKKIIIRLFSITKRIRDYLLFDLLKISTLKYPISRFNVGMKELNTLFISEININNSDFLNILEQVGNNYLKHELMFFGKEWFSINRNQESNENTLMTNARILNQNKKQAERILRLLNSTNDKYSFIDWQKDFINGGSWVENKLAKTQRYTNDSDIKIPWELGRMQHLPQLAMWFYINRNSEQQVVKNNQNKILNELKCQILDFIIFNPPKFGMQWYHSMDVGIRIANWLITYDILKISNADFEDEFDDILYHSIMQHGHHIYKNLEKSGDKRGNHYFANIIGLLFIGYYLPKNKHTSQWLDRAIFSFVEEFDFQFFDDGGNIEGSTAYHRLVSEFVLWGSIIIEKIAPEKCNNARKKVNNRLPFEKYLSKTTENYLMKSFFSDYYYSKFNKISKLLLDVTKPDGTALLIGDNDSGRLFKLMPDKQQLINRNSILINEPTFINTIAMLNGFYKNDITNLPDPYYLENNIISAILDHDIIYVNDEKTPVINIDYPDILIKKISGAKKNRTKYSVKQNEKNTNRKIIIYPDFGLYLIKSNNLYIAVRCGGRIIDGISGHFHVDQLHVELSCDYTNIIIDSGMPKYSSNKDLRNKYRSSSGHFLPSIISTLDFNFERLFALSLCSFGECLFFNKTMFVGKWDLHGLVFYRIINIGNKNIEITDYFDSNDILSDDQINSIHDLKASPIYGYIDKQIKTTNSERINV